MSQIDPDCAAGIDCEGCSHLIYCPQRDDEGKRRRLIPQAWGDLCRVCGHTEALHGLGFSETSHPFQVQL